MQIISGVAIQDAPDLGEAPADIAHRTVKALAPLGTPRAVSCIAWRTSVATAPRSRPWGVA